MSRRPRREDLIATTLLLSLVLGAAIAVGFVFVETEFRPEGSAFGLPARLPVCGRRFIHAPSPSLVTKSDIDAGIASGARPIILEPTIGEVALLAPFEQHPTPGGMTTCDVLVFLRVGRDAYVPYGLEGGP